jgi:hypothetical protein
LILTVLALGIAIWVPGRQQKQVRDDAVRRRTDRMAGLRHALHTEIGMAGFQCRKELDSWLKAELSPAQKNPRTARLAPLRIYEANAGAIGLLTREEIVPLVGFSGTLHDISVVVEDMIRRGSQDPKEYQTLQLLLSNACGAAADFLEAVPGIEGRVQDRRFID